MIKKYTPSEYAIMEGGHSLPEQNTGLEFIQTLGEARMFRSKNQIQKEGARSLADHLFVSMMSLYTMSQDYNYAPVAKEYAKRTTQLGNFNRPSPSGSDLYQTIFSLQQADSLLPNEKDKLLMNKVNIRSNNIKLFLNKIKQGNVTPAQAQQFFFKLEKDLKIQDPKLRAARRLAQDWPSLTSTQQKLVGTQLNRYYRMNARRSDLMPLFSKYTKDNDLIMNQKEKQSVKGAIVKGVAAFAAGYAVGKALPS